MSLPRHCPPVEPETSLVAMFEQPDRIPKAVRRQADFYLFFARTIFPLLESYRERLTSLYCSDNGRPAWDPVRLLGVLILQFISRTPDRQAAEAVQYDCRWRLALHLGPEDMSFDPSLLVVFRNRLVEGEKESLVFEAVLDYLVEHGWVAKRSRQRLDSTHVWGLLKVMGRLEHTRATIRLLLEDLEADGLLPEAWSEYWECYVAHKLEHRMDVATLQKKLVQAGRDMLAIWQEAAGNWRIHSCDGFVLMQRVFLENFELDSREGLQKRASLPSNSLQNPHEPEAQWSSKARTKDKSWVGYKQQVAETVEAEPRQPGEPTASFLTAMVTQSAIESEEAGMRQVLQEQQKMGLERPCALYVDGAYVGSKALKDAEGEGWQLRGPAPATPPRAGMLTVESFDVNVEERYAICPSGQRSSNCSRVVEQHMAQPHVIYRIEWSNAVCMACALSKQCFSSQYSHRTIVVNPFHSFLQARRLEMKTDAFKLEMHRRAAIEGTHSELIRNYGLRHSRYRGKAKVRLQAYLIGAACNIRRLFRRVTWLTNQARDVDAAVIATAAG